MLYRIWVGDLLIPPLPVFAVEKNGSVHIRDGVFYPGRCNWIPFRRRILLGEDSGVYKMHIGNPDGDHLSWDGTDMRISAGGGLVSLDNGLNLSPETASQPGEMG